MAGGHNGILGAVVARKERARMDSNPGNVGAIVQDQDMEETNARKLAQNSAVIIFCWLSFAQRGDRADHLAVLLVSIAS